ncbi:MAG: C25 family cysteine peptidase [Kiritimatiellia bacterium]
MLLGIVLASCGAGAATMTVEVASELRLVREGEGWVAVRGAELDYPLEPIGAPSLPWRMVSIEIPAGATVGQITLEGEWQTLAEDATLAPIQVVDAIGEPRETVSPDEALYARSWPAQTIESLGTIKTLGKTLLRVKVTPVRYSRRTIEALTNARLVLELDEPSAAARTASSAAFSLNPVAASTQSLSHRYLLISPPAYTNEWQAYLDLRRSQRPDVEFVLKNAQEIYATYPFDATNTAGVARNPAESIHQFIRENVAANPADNTYVVLGGTWVDAANITSMDDTRLSTKMPGIIAKSAEFYSHYPLTDLFYACLDVEEGKYPWDGNGNGNYADSGELGNSANDYYPDIVVSRIPLRSTKLGEAAVIAAFTEKMRRAEADDFAGAHRYGSAGGQLDTTYSASSGYFLRGEQEFFDGGINQFDPRRSSSFVDCEVVPRRSLKNILARRRPVLGGNPLFPNSWGADYDSQAAGVTGFFASDRDYTEYRDHGSSTYLYGGYVTVERHLNATGISRIILAGYSCMTGYIDGDNVALAEAEIVSAQGGALASVHNTRFGLSYAGRGASDEDNLSSTLQYRIKLKLMNEDCDLGTAWLKTRQGYCGNAGGQARFVMMEQMLFGDPLVALRPAVAAATLTESAAYDSDTGFTYLTMPGGTRIEGDKLVKVMQTLTVTGEGDFTFAADGGVGGGVAFADEGEHVLTLASPAKGYFAAPSNATEVAISGSGVTLDLGAAQPDFTTLTLNGGATHQTGNVIRGTTEGQLAAVLPLVVTNTEVLFSTRDAFLRRADDNSVTEVAEDKITVIDGTVGFFTNPNVGLAYGRWDGFYCPVELDNGNILVKSTQTAAFGHSAKPGLEVAVAGSSSVATAAGGKITLFGTTTFTLAEGATLDLAAAFAVSSTADSKMVIENRGKVTVADATGLAGEVTVNGGTLQLSAIPLQNVTKLTLTGDVKLVLPKDEGGFYQILPVQGASLVMSGATVTVASTDGETETTLVGEFTATNAFFDKSAFLVWNSVDGNWNTTETNWLRDGEDVAYSAGDKAYFPDIENADVVAVKLTEEVACDFVNFGNAASAYTFTGERLSVKSLLLGTPVAFSNDVYSSAGVLASGGTTDFADLTTPTLDIASGAEASALTLGNTISTIKGIRFYPRVMRGGGSTCSLAELRFYSGSTEVTLSDATKSDAPGYSSTNQGYLWDGVVSGIVMATGGEKVWQVTVGSAAEFANDQYYLQFMFSQSKPMVTSYKLAGGYNTYLNAPTSFRVDVTADGISWITVSTVSGASTAGNGFGELWYTSGACSCSNGGPTAVSIAEGGAYGLAGTPNATFTCEAGAVFKAVADSALQYNANCTFAYPEEGTIAIDPAALNLADGTSARVIANNGKTFSHADLAHFSVAEGYTLERDDSGLNVVKQTALAGPYRRTLAGGRTTWAETGWTADTVAEGGTWDSATRQPCADVELLTTADTVLEIAESVSFGTLRQQTLPEGEEGSEVDRSAYANRLRIEKADGATVEAVVYDLSAFEGRVTIAFSTGAATVIAGTDTRLRANGTGKLVVGEGMKVTLYFAGSWGGTIENNGGTVEYRTPLAAPQVEFR